MKSQKDSKLKKKYACAITAPSVADLINAHRLESPCYRQCEAETEALFEQILQDARARSWSNPEEYRQPTPLGPLRVEYDEDGVPTYLS